MPEFDAHKFAQQVTEMVERVADVSDAARGKARRRSGGLARWLILPAAGAAVYAAAKRASAVGGSTGAVVRGANERADTPDMDLLSRVKDIAGLGADRQEEYERGKAKQRETSRTAAPSTTTRELEEHRRERAERRGESASAR
jgi:hypothetical protein